MDKLENDMSSKRMMTAMGFSFLAYFIWIAFFAPQQMTTPVQSAPSNSEAGSNEQSNIIVSDQQNDEDNDVSEDNTGKNEPSVDASPSKYIENTSLKLEVGSNHGAIKSISLIDHRELPIKQSWWSWIFSGGEEEWTPYSPGKETLNLMMDGSFIQVGSGKPKSILHHNIEQKSNSTVLTRSQAGGLIVKKTYSLTDDPNVLNITVDIKNNSARDIEDIWIGVADVMQEDSSRFMDAMRPQFHADEDVESYMDVEGIDKDPETIPHSPSWFGLGSRYFLAAVSEEIKEGDSPQIGSVSPASFGNERYGSIGHLTNGLKNQEETTLNFQAYIGPKVFDDLSKMSPEWGEAVEFGIFGFFSKFLLFLLKIFYAGFNNWGIAIIFLTLTMKVVFFPLTQKGYESGKKMQLLAPKMNEIKEKYKDNSQLQAQEMMKLYREHNASPLGGCLPMLIQMPIWFALYNALLYSVELYDSSFLYLKDLTSSDPYGVLPVVYGVLMYATQKFMTPPVTANMGDQQKMMMKMMKWMPIMFTLFMFTFPSGLVLYFSCNSLLTILQQWLIKRKMEKNPIVLAS